MSNYFKKKYLLLAFIICILPLISLASGSQTFKSMIETFVKSIKEPLVSLFTSAAVTTFAWGVVKYIKGGEVSKESAKELIVWGLLGITVISAVWAFVSAMKKTLGLD